MGYLLEKLFQTRKHSSMMGTARLPTIHIVIAVTRCQYWRGVSCPGWMGVYPLWYTCPPVYPHSIPSGIPTPSSRSISALWYSTRPPPDITTSGHTHYLDIPTLPAVNRHALVKILPSRNFVGGRLKFSVNSVLA